MKKRREKAAQRKTVAPPGNQVAPKGAQISKNPGEIPQRNPPFGGGERTGFGKRGVQKEPISQFGRVL